MAGKTSVRRIAFAGFATSPASPEIVPGLTRHYTEPGFHKFWIDPLQPATADKGEIGIPHNAVNRFLHAIIQTVSVLGTVDR